MKNLSTHTIAASTKRFVTSRSGIICLLILAVLATGLVVLGGRIATQAVAAGAHQHGLATANSEQQATSHEHGGATVSTAGATTNTNPATQKQVSLASAASQEKGNGTTVDKPAADVTGTQKQVDPLSVLPNTKATGVLSSGCAVGYGQIGTQCLSARAANNKPMTCTEARKQFPSGIAVTGNDQLNLDSNKNGVACDAGDKA